MESASGNFCLNVDSILPFGQPKPLALSIFRDLLKTKRVINILPNLQAYFNKRRYFPILMSTFVLMIEIFFKNPSNRENFYSIVTPK